MKIAIPLTDGYLSTHFGQCDEFAIVIVDEQAQHILSKSVYRAPPHEPGLLPRWLHRIGTEVIITAGIGQRAQHLFEQNGISVVVGVPPDTPERLTFAYLNGTLRAGANVCDH
jgi:predicted Fe-Mo cluster-binding NifX family protein